MKKTYFISLILLLVVVAFGVILGGADVTAYIDFPSMVIIVLPVIFVLLSAYSAGDIGRAFSRPFADDAGLEELLQAENIFKSMRKTMWFAGAIGFFIGNIAMLSLLITENYFSGFAVAVLVLFYALILDLIVVVPYLTGIRKRIIALENMA